MANNNKKIFFQDVVTLDSQWNQLSLELSTAAPARGWRALGERLMKKTAKELDVLEKKENPVRALLNDWQATGTAYTDNLISALEAIDNYTVKRLIDSWIKEYLQNPSGAKNDAHSITPTMLRDVSWLGDLENQLSSCLDKKTYLLSWHNLADELGYTNSAIDGFKFKESPTEALLENWKNQKESTVQRLLAALSSMNHDTAVKIIRDHCQKHKVPLQAVNVQPAESQQSKQPPPAQPAPNQPPTQPAPKNDANSVIEIPSEELTRQEKIGEGSFSSVYKGEWHRIPVALKEFKLVGATPVLKKGFLQEATTLAQCQNPKIVRFYGINMDQDKYTIVMEYAPNGSLHSVLEDESVPLPWDVRIQIAKGIAQGVAFIHERNMLHCDLKSLNVLLDENFQPKLADFGLAKVKLGTQTGTILPVGTTLGTLRWKAPEMVAKPIKPNKATDVYSMGMVFWEIASRSIPYAQGDTEMVLNWIKNSETEEIPDDCPARFAEIIKSCWKPANERPTAAAIEASLDEVLKDLALPAELQDVPKSSPSDQTSNVNNQQPAQPPVVSIPKAASSEIVIPSKVASSPLTVSDLMSDHIYQLAKQLDREAGGKIPAVLLAVEMHINDEEVTRIRRSQSPTKSLLNYIAVFGKEQRKLSYLYKKLMEHDPPMEEAAEIVESAI